MAKRSYRSWSLLQSVLIGLSLIFISCEEQKRVIEPFIPTGERIVLLEEFTGKKVHLELSIKVAGDWRNNERMLRDFGYE